MSEDRGKPDATGSKLLRPDRRTVLKMSALGGAALAMKPFGALAEEATPKSGGELRIGALGGASSDTLDPHLVTTQPDALRQPMFAEPLNSFDPNGKLVNLVAESMEPNANGTEWTIRVRPIKFQNGKDVKASDVLFTFRRIADPKAPKFGASALANVDLQNAKILDDRTLRLTMTQPYAAFPESISAFYNFGIVPEGFDPAAPIGTGSFKYKSFKAGERSTFERFDEYWQGKPHLDAITVIDFASDTAAMNALRGGEIDAFTWAPPSLSRQVGASDPIKVYLTKPAQWVPLTMRTDIEPFNNPDIRKAFRLLVDRKQVVKVAYSGLAEPANDLFANLDPAFDGSLKREYDPDQAKSLLKKAGADKIVFTATTSDIAFGAVQIAQVFAQQASKLGITVKVDVKTPDVFYGEGFLKYPLGQDWWQYSPYISQVSQSMLATSPFNETHFDHPRYTDLYNQCQTIVDAAKRVDLIHEMQRIEFDEGGYIIATLNQTMDLASDKVHWVEPSPTGYPVGLYQFHKLWMD